MIHSMTGYGEARCDREGVSYRVEIRSVNNRYFKAAIKLPEAFQYLETEVDKLLRSRLGRGSIAFSLRIRDKTPAAAYEINEAALQRYVEQLRRAVGDLEGVRVDVSGLVDLPGVCQPPEADPARQAGQLELVRGLTAEATDRLIEMRRTEGAALLVDIKKQCRVILEETSAVSDRSPDVVREYHERLKSRVQELLHAGDVQLDAEVLAREVAVFAERCDVNEETARLQSHLQQFAELCDGPEEAGRKLEFISQELLREANTIGSKANDAEIGRRVVEIKAAIDRIKEQVQNVE